MNLAARLAALESSGRNGELIKEVCVTAPRPMAILDKLDSCQEHPRCRVQRAGPIASHYSAG